MKNSFMLIKNRENWKIIWRSKKICESVYLKGIVASLLKMKFLVTLNPKEGRRRRRKKDLKLFENWSWIKIIWKYGFENWNFGKLFENGSFENWNFEEVFENGISWKLNLNIGILENYLKIEVLKIKFENWYFEKLFENESFEN